MEEMVHNITDSYNISSLLENYTDKICFYNLTTICLNPSRVDLLWKTLLLMGYESDYISEHPCYCFYHNTEEDREFVETYLPVKFVFLEHAVRLVIFRNVVPIISCLGFVGNLCALVTFSQSRRFTARTFSYFKWLAFSDLMVDILAFPSIAKMGWDMWYLHSYANAFYYAYVAPVTMGTFIGASSLLLVAITVDRFIAVCFPHQFNRLVTRKRTKIIIIGLCFIIPLVFGGLPVLLETEVYELQGGFLLSNDSGNALIPLYALGPPREYRGSRTYKFIVFFGIIAAMHLTLIALPTITVVTYVRQRNRMRRSRTSAAVTVPSIPLESRLTSSNNQNSDAAAQNISRQSQRETDRHRLQDSKQTQLVLAVFTCIMYITLLTPVLIIATGVTSAHTGLFSSNIDLLLWSVSAVIVCNTSFNFYVYCAVSGTVRREFFTLVKKCGQKLCWRK